MTRLRPATAADSRTCFGIFRRSLWDFMQRVGYQPLGAPAPDIEARWGQAEKLFAHLAATCEHWWLAEDEDRRPVGYGALDTPGHDA